jgi:hypothetical protein
MTPSPPDDTTLDPSEEACLRRVMVRLRARLSPGGDGHGGKTADERNPSRQYAAVCGEIVTE